MMAYALVSALVTAFGPTPAALTRAAPARSSVAVLQYGVQQPLPAGWTSAVDAATGTPYYCYDQTGQCQWDLPVPQQAGYSQPQSRYSQQQGSYTQQQQQNGFGMHQGWGGTHQPGAPVLCRLTPAFGVTSEYAVRNGEEQVVGRYDMADQDEKSGRMYVSRAQCLIQVATDGTPTLTSIGKNPTGLRRRHGAPWYGLSKGATHVLLDGEQVALNVNQAYNPYTAVYTVQLARDEMQMGVGVGVGVGGYPQQGFEGYGQQGGYPQQGGY